MTIATRIGERTDRDISIGAVYATLGRLSDKGYVSFSYSDPEPVRGGRARKLVALTPAGVRALNRTTTALGRMLEGVALSVGFVAARSLGSILYGVSPTDPIAMGGATAVLVATILAACYAPARRAAAVDPARTLAEQ